jgi:Zn-dependent M28 family amino/carboxypeptidase
VRKISFALFVFVSFNLPAQQFFNELALLKNLKILSADSMQGRRTGTNGNSMAAQYIKAQFKKWGVQPLGTDYELPFEFQNRGQKMNGINLAGMVTGKSTTEKYIVISAHYDHEGVKNGNIYNGADDNASGVSALLAIIENLKRNPPLHNIILVAFDAEEVGLQGARAFVQNPPIELSKILMNINMDMVARADNNILGACGAFFYPELKPILEKVKPTGKVQLKIGFDDPSVFKNRDNWTYASDHAAFHSAKIPFIYFGVDDHADYHKPGDDYEKISASTFIEATKLIILSFREFDKGLN